MAEVVTLKWDANGNMGIEYPKENPTWQEVIEHPAAKKMMEQINSGVPETSYEFGMAMMVAFLAGRTVEKELFK